jgi:hypothetical protein
MRGELTLSGLSTSRAPILTNMDSDFDEGIGIPIPTPKSFASEGIHRGHQGMLILKVPAIETRPLKKTLFENILPMHRKVFVCGICSNKQC